MSNKCPKCGSGDVYVEVLYPYHSVNLGNCRACGYLGDEPEFTITTVFEQITASPEVLAPKFVYEATTCAGDGYILAGYRSTITAGFWHTESEAIAATVAKLKEVEKRLKK